MSEESAKDNPEKKIIVDEDWKTRVTAEKEAAEKQQAESDDDQSGQSESAASAEEGAYPPASFEMLISSLATEAMMAMGQIPHPVTGQAEANLDQARYAIDLLEILQEKTKGNLDDQQDNALRDILHQLRMSYIAANT